jgi:hypothetical protein
MGSLLEELGRREEAARAEADRLRARHRGLGDHGHGVPCQVHLFSPVRVFEGLRLAMAEAKSLLTVRGDLFPSPLGSPMVGPCRRIGRGAVGTDELILQVLPTADSDAEELADLAAGLQAELLSTDVVAVAPLTAEAAPERAKGAGTLAGWLAAQFGTLAGLHAAVAAVRGWASRTSRTVEISIGGDVLKVTAATSQQQDEIIAAWLARHASGA